MRWPSGQRTTGPLSRSLLVRRAVFALSRLSVFRLRPQPIGRRRGQIAALFVMLLSILLILMMFLVNVGQVGWAKTTTANAADAASLSITSSVGTISRQLALQLGDGDEYIKKKCETDLTLVFDILIIIASVILAFFTAGLAVVLAIATAVSTAINATIREVLVNPEIARQFNKQFEKLASLKDQIRENGILTAFLRTVDDPNTVPDERDIDEDGDTTEQIPAFADWYDRRLAVLVGESQAQVPNVLSSMQALQDEVAELKEAVERLQGSIDEIIIPQLEDVEELGIDVTFWLPGGQTSSPDEPTDCALTNEGTPDDLDSEDYDTEEFVEPCGPGAAGAPDQLDWLKVQIEDFLAWAEQVLSLDEAQLIPIADQVQEDLAFWKEELAKWSAVLGDLIAELEDVQIQLDALCAAAAEEEAES
jgi:hypothetical protein